MEGTTQTRKVATLDPVASLGPQIRALRQTKGLTLAQMAERTHLSVGYLSQIERGISTPTIRQLQNISLTMGVQISWFFRHETVAPIEEGLIVRAAHRRALHMTGLGITDYLLVPDLDRQLELLLCVLEPGAGSGEEAYTHQGEEAGILLAGRLELWVGRRYYLLEQGDSFAFASTKPHRYRNPGLSETRIVWAVTPPTY